MRLPPPSPAAITRMEEALLWLRWVDGVTLAPTDWIGAGISLAGMVVIAAGRPPGP